MLNESDHRSNRIGRNGDAGLESFHEGFGSKLGDHAKPVHNVSFGDANTKVSEGQCLGILVGNNVDEEVQMVGKGLIADLVQGVEIIQNQLTEETCLIGIDGIYDQLSNLAWKAKVSTSTQAYGLGIQCVVCNVPISGPYNSLYLDTMNIGSIVLEIRDG